MSTVENVKSILNDQIGAYRILLDVLQREREYLVHFNAPEVEALSKEKDTIVLKLRLLEEERCRLIKMFASENHVADNISLLRLTEMTGDQAFQRLRLQLVSLLQGIVEMNEFNRVLIERSSSMIRNALDFLGSFGVIHQSRNTGSLFSREA